MDRISGYSQVSEIIPFDYSQPFLLFPVGDNQPCLLVAAHQEH